MSTSDPLIVRRVLASLLRQLDEGAQADSAKGTPPVVMVVLGQASDPERSLDEPSGMINQCSCQTESRAATAVTTTARALDKEASHPGHNKFDLKETDSKSRAPKTCFMEPDRVCVNSGACEMLGY